MPRRRCPETRSERGSSGEMTDSVLEERKKKKKGGGGLIMREISVRQKKKKIQR